MARRISGLRSLAIVVLVFGISGWLLMRPLPGVLTGHALHRDAPGFAETPCTHVEPGAAEHQGRYSTYFEPLLVCDFSVDHQQHRTDSRYSELGFTTYRAKDKAIAAAKQRAAGNPLHAYYDPHEPARATMSRDVKYDAYEWVLIAIGALLVLLGILGAVLGTVHAVRGYRRARRARADFPSAQVR